MLRASVVVAALLLLFPVLAWAQEDDEDSTPTIGGKPVTPAPSAPAAPSVPSAPSAPETPALSKPEYTPPKMDVPKTTTEAPAAAPRGKRLVEVEKGFYLEMDMGYVRALATDIPALSDGMLTGFVAGYDIIDILSVEAGYMGAFVFADNPTGESINPDTSAVSSDFSMQIMHAAVKVSYLSTDHWFFYLRAGGGFAFNSPSSTRKSDRTVVEVSSSAPIVLAAPGVEYYTDVRHFSIGLDAKGLLLPTLSTYFVSAMPYVKYTF